MSEDYTWDNWDNKVLSREQIAARVAELERVNAELRARLDAVPVAEIRAVVGASVTPMGYRSERDVIATWLNSRAVQP